LVNTSLGYAWMPYAIGGVALLILGLVARIRARRGTGRSLTEMLVIRGTALLAIGVLAALLADAAAEGDGLTAADRPIWTWLVAHRTGTLTTIAKVVTTVGSTGAMTALAGVAAIVLFFVLKRRADAILVAAVTAGVGLVVTVAKPIINRVRPPEEYRLVVETNQSFPSGHAVASMAVLGVCLVVFLPLIRAGWTRAVVAVAVAVFVGLVGVSRLYLGVHWPTDIMGGWLTGFGIVLLCVTVKDVLTRRDAKVLLPAAHPGQVGISTDTRAPDTRAAGTRVTGTRADDGSAAKGTLDRLAQAPA
jgi:undecaprenyl-diphosphatase